MRRKDKLETGSHQIEQILQSCKICRLAIQDDPAPYIVPLNYGYTWKNGLLCLYFHSAQQGKKISLLQANNAVGFEISRMHGIKGIKTLACSYTCKFESITGTGQAVFLHTQEEKYAALANIMEHLTGRQDFFYDENILRRTAVFQVKVTGFSAKRSKNNN